MKRRWLGVILMAWASVSALFAYAPVVSAAAACTLSKDAQSIVCSGVAAKGNATFTYNQTNLDYEFVDNSGASASTDTIDGLGSVANSTNYTGTLTIGSSNTTSTVTVAATAADATPPTTTGPTGANGENCVAGSFTWIVCPLITSLISVAQWIEQNVIVPFIVEPPFDKSQPSIAPVYQIWTHMRDVASVFFILIFFLIIFGTAIGFNNYTIKKVLPHLVAGAIIMPFSWYICAIGIDIGNIIGQGMVSLMGSIIPKPTIDFGSDLEVVFYGAGAAAGAVLLATIALSTFSVGVLVTIVIALLATFFTLILRKILIILLVILSPFAILCWILPNTEKIYKMWWTNLSRLIMMYPLILLLFEAGRLFATVAGSTLNGPGSNAVKPLFQLTGLFLPLAMVPWTFSMAGGALKMGSSAIGKLGSAADSRWGKNSAGAKERHDRFQQKRASAAMPGSGANGFSRRLARKQSGTGGFLPQSKAAQLKMRQMADKHKSFESDVQGAAKADKGLLDEANKIEQAANAGLATGTMTAEQHKSEMDRASSIRKTLNSKEQIGLMTQAKTDQVVAHHGELEGLAHANEQAPPNVARQLTAASTLAADKVLGQRADQEAVQEITFTDSKGRTRSSRIQDLDPDKDAIEELRKRSETALSDGNQAAAIAMMRKMGESGRGRDQIVDMQRELLGGDRDKGIVVGDQHKAMMRQVTEKINTDKAPDLVQAEEAAFTDVDITKFLGFDKRTKERYLQFAEKAGARLKADGSPDEGGQRALAEAVANVNAATEARYRNRLSADDVEAIYGNAGSVITGSNRGETGGIARSGHLSPTALAYYESRRNMIGGGPPPPPPPPDPEPS